MKTSRAAVYSLLLFLSTAILAGCASYPISKPLRMQVNRDITFQMVNNDPQAYVGKIVIWGGYIIQTTNVNDGTEILVLDTPLDRAEMPAGARHSQGRFIAKSKAFLDPAIYKENKRITLAGEITGVESRTLGESKYSYPVVQIKEVHLWRRQRVYVYEPADYWWYYPWGPWDGTYEINDEEE